jgi:hypothetical protein
VLVAGPRYLNLPRGMARRHDVVRGETGDAEFDGALHVFAGDKEGAVPPLSAAMRRALLDLHAALGESSFFALTPAGIAIAVPVYGRILDDSRRLLEPRLMAANEADELRREAELLARVPQAALLLSRAAGEEDRPGLSAPAPA